MNTDFITWGIDPVLVSLAGISIHWYGVMFAGGFVLGFLYMKKLYQQEGRNVEELDRLLYYIMGGTIIGARLGHCLLYDPGFYLSNPLKILAIWEGGLASHGGGAGVLIALYLYLRKTGDSYLWLLDRLVVPTALVAFFIRFGNFFNSEIVGIKTSVPWAIIFERLDNVPRHPAQLYEALSYLTIFFVLWFVFQKTKAASLYGLISGLFLIMVFTARFLIEFVKTKQAAYSSDLWLSTGQLLSIPFVAVGLVLVVMAMKRSVEAK